MVHPSPTAKGGKFDCALTSLSVLLDYRIEDNKEHSFEVKFEVFIFGRLVSSTLVVQDIANMKAEIDFTFDKYQKGSQLLKLYSGFPRPGKVMEFFFCCFCYPGLE